MELYGLAVATVIFRMYDHSCGRAVTHFLPLKLKICHFLFCLTVFTIQFCMAEILGKLDFILRKLISISGYENSTVILTTCMFKLQQIQDKVLKFTENS